MFIPKSEFVSPLDINENVLTLARKLNTGFEPKIVPVKVEKDALLQSCFGNVERKIARDGGSIIYGWIVWKSNILCEGEFHAVWKSPDGQLIDVTPQEKIYDKVMFIPEPKKKYQGQSIDNVRINITSNKVVDDFILVCETTSKAYSSGKRSSELILTLPEPVLHIIHSLEGWRNSLLKHILQGKGRRDPCICGSGKKYKNCHEINLKQQMSKTLVAIQKYST